METRPWLVRGGGGGIASQGVWGSERKWIEGLGMPQRFPPLTLLLPIQFVGCEAGPFRWYSKGGGMVTSRLRGEKKKGPSPNLFTKF